MKHFIIAMVPVLLIAAGCGAPEKKDMNKDFTDFLVEFEKRIAPLNKDANLAYFNATMSGKDEDYKQSADLELERSRLFADTAAFARLKAIKESGSITDPLLARQLLVLYNAYLSKQIDDTMLERMVRMQNETEKKFSTFRAEINGKLLTDNQIEEILKNSKNSAELENAWTASKRVGETVKGDVLALVKLRNEAARGLGFKNYHAMQLELSEQDPDAIETLFDELDALTRDAFAALKNDIDTYLSARLGLPKEKLMPWHYQNRFFQEAPKIYDVDLDGFYKGKDIVALATSYFAGIGLPIDDMVAKSDLFERPGKYQHAYCTDIDREGDVRVVCNITPSYNWMNTTLHEYGHAVYSKFLDRKAPWILREEAHTFTTEAIAMLFGRFAAHPAWLKDVAGVAPEAARKAADASRKSLRLEQLVFSRWVQVMYRFEKAMYEDPGQDLNALWWRLVEKYQMLRAPEGRNAPDWASKIHVALYPAYYHNYMMGELLASQLWYSITGTVLGGADPEATSFSGKTDVGAWLKEKIFMPARTLFWNDMIQAATGEKLTAKHYAKQFVN